MRKILIPILSRASWGRLESVVNNIKNHPDLELQLVVGASMVNQGFGCIYSVNHKIDAIVRCTIEGNEHECMATTTGLLITQLVQIFNQLKPDIVLVHADRFEQLAVATAASYMSIPLSHTQGGEVSGNIDNKVRKAITALADIHFPATELSMSKVLDMGANPSMVVWTGCPSIDNIKDLKRKPKDYILCVLHPVTTDTQNTRNAMEVLHALINTGRPIIWLHSNIDAGNKDINPHIKSMLKDNKLQSRIKFIDSVSPDEFNKLMAECWCMVGNTSSGIREGSYLGVPYVCIGDRQRFREMADNTIVCKEYDSFEIRKAINNIGGKTFDRQYLFGDGTAGGQIADLLAEVKVKAVSY